MLTHWQNRLNSFIYITIKSKSPVKKKKQFKQFLDTKTLILFASDAEELLLCVCVLVCDEMRRELNGERRRYSI